MWVIRKKNKKEYLKVNGEFTSDKYHAARYPFLVACEVLDDLQSENIQFIMLLAKDED